MSHDRPGGSYIPPRRPAAVIGSLREEAIAAAIRAAADSPLGTVAIDEDGRLVTDGRYVVLATMTRVVSWPRFEPDVASQDVLTIHVVQPLA